MKLFVVLTLLAVAAAAPQQQRAPRQGVLGAVAKQVVQLLRFDSDKDGNGKYGFRFEQSDGQKRQEQGELRNAGAENEAIAVKGSYEYIGPDGVTYVVNYVADENGYQPVIEQGPGGAVPAGVLASLLGSG